MKTSLLTAAAVSVSVLLLAACAKAPAPLAAAPAQSFQLYASVIDLMSGPIDKAADFLWDSVGTESSPKGPVDKLPKNDKEWAAVREQAVLLAEASNLLMMEGRVVAHPGQKLENPPGEGDLTPEQSLAAINADRATFVGFARALQATAASALKATEARDVDALLEAGGQIDEACEACHKKFWYPGAPTAPGTEPAAK